MKYELIFASTLDGWIGRPDGQLPFSQRADMKHFREQTVGEIVLMGRKTYESLGKALPNRGNLILSRTLPKIVDTGLWVVNSFDEVQNKLEFVKGTKIIVIGGAELYRQALNVLPITTIHHTTVHTTIPEAAKAGGWTDFRLPSTLPPHTVTQVGAGKADDKNQFDWSIRRYDISLG